MNVRIDWSGVFAKDGRRTKHTATLRCTDWGEAQNTIKKLVKQIEADGSVYEQAATIILESQTVEVMRRQV